MKQPKGMKLNKLLKKSPGKEARIIGKKIRKPKDRYAFLHIPTGKYFHYNKFAMFPENSKQILTAPTKKRLLSKFFALEIGTFNKTYSIDNLIPQEINSNFVNPITCNDQNISTKIPNLLSIDICDFWEEEENIASFQMNIFLVPTFDGFDSTTSYQIVDSEEIEFENLEANLIKIFETLQTEGYVIDPGLYQFSSDKNTRERISLSEFEIVLLRKLNE